MTKPFSERCDLATTKELKSLRRSRLAEIDKSARSIPFMTGAFLEHYEQLAREISIIETELEERNMKTGKTTFTTAHALDNESIAIINSHAKAAGLNKSAALRQIVSEWAEDRLSEAKTAAYVLGSEEAGS